MQESSNDLLTRVVGYAVGFVGVGGLLGYLQYRLSARRAPTDISLAGAQTDEIRARIRREDETAAVTNLRAVTAELRADVERLRDERNYWRERAEKAERRWLVEELDRLPGPPGS